MPTETSYVLSLGGPGRMTVISEVEKRRNLNRYILVRTDIGEKRFVVFEHAIEHLFLGCVHSP